MLFPPGDPSYDPPDPVPPPCSEETVEEWRREKRIERLASYLEEHPFALLDVPCEKIDFYENLAEYIPPESVQQRALRIGAFWQQLETAAGAVVKMDHFGVTVPASAIPNGWSATRMLEHVRRKINDFVDTGIARFLPYPGLGGEWNRWRSDEPLGSVLSIHNYIAGQWLRDDGTVILSRYRQTNWVFSTLFTPADFSHPVSGNRIFGVVANGNGTYTFFTRGVSRISSSSRVLANLVTGGLLFESANDLWRSFQAGIKAFVGDAATVRPPQIYPVDSDMLLRVFDREKPVSSLGQCN